MLCCPDCRIFRLSQELLIGGPFFYLRAVHTGPKSHVYMQKISPHATRLFPFPLGKGLGVGFARSAVNEFRLVAQRTFI